MKKILIYIYIVFYLSFVIGHLSLANAEYVLPYPSFMPGNKMYRVSRIMDKLKNYWHWGTIAQIQYHLGLSDKYLVEAKTLFEYKQYLLATDALLRSDVALSDITALIEKGKNEGKDMSVLQEIVVEAMKMHISTIEHMKQWLPNEFQWTPEKADATVLSIGAMLDDSMHIRTKVRGTIDTGLRQ